VAKSKIRRPLFHLLKNAVAIAVGYGLGSSEDSLGQLIFTADE
jgi:hypothetical protein